MPRFIALSPQAGQAELTHSEPALEGNRARLAPGNTFFLGHSVCKENSQVGKDALDLFSSTAPKARFEMLICTRA